MGRTRADERPGTVRKGPKRQQYWNTVAGAVEEWLANNPNQIPPRSFESPNFPGIKLGELLKSWRSRGLPKDCPPQLAETITDNFTGDRGASLLAAKKAANHRGHFSGGGATFWADIESALAAALGKRKPAARRDRRAGRSLVSVRSILDQFPSTPDGPRREPDRQRRRFDSGTDSTWLPTGIRRNRLSNSTPDRARARFLRQSDVRTSAADDRSCLRLRDRSLFGSYDARLGSFHEPTYDRRQHQQHVRGRCRDRQLEYVSIARLRPLLLRGCAIQGSSPAPATHAISAGPSVTRRENLEPFSSWVAGRPRRLGERGWPAPSGWLGVGSNAAWRGPSRS